MTVADERDNLVVSPTLPESESDIMYTISVVNEMTPLAENTSATIPFSIGDTKEIVITLTAEGAPPSNYIVRATRRGSNNANLSVLRIVSGEDPLADFDNLDTNIDYGYTIPNPIVGTKISSVRLEAALDDPNAEIMRFTIDNVSADITDPILLNEGQARVARIVVRAEDRRTMKIYTVTIRRQASQDTRLNMLRVSQGELEPAFMFDADSASQRNNYSIELPSNAANTMITAAAFNANTTLVIRDQSRDSGSASQSASLTVAIDLGTSKDIIIVATAQDGSSRDYTVTLSRASAMDIDDLGFELRMTNVNNNGNLSADSATGYTGRLSGMSTNTVVSASVGITGVSIRSIRVSDDSTNYVLGRSVPLTANSNFVRVSRVIPLARNGARMAIVLRRIDRTSDRYTEQTYTVNIVGGVIRIRAKVFLEGPLQ